MSADNPKANRGAGTNNVQEMLNNGAGPSGKGIGGTVSTMEEIIGGGNGNPMSGQNISMDTGGGGSDHQTANIMAAQRAAQNASMNR